MKILNKRIKFGKFKQIKGYKRDQNKSVLSGLINPNADIL